MKELQTKQIIRLDFRRLARIIVCSQTNCTSYLIVNNTFLDSERSD